MTPRDHVANCLTVNLFTYFKMFNEARKLSHSQTLRFVHVAFFFFLCSSHFTHFIPVTSISTSVVTAFPADRHGHLERSSSVLKIVISAWCLTLTALLLPMLLCILRCRAAEDKCLCLQYACIGCPPSPAEFMSSLCILFWTLTLHSVFYSR